MASSFHFLVAILVLFFVITSSTDSTGPWGTYCQGSSITPDSPVAATIHNFLAAMFSASQMNIAFSGLSSGNGKDAVYGLAQCREDLDTKKYCYPCIRQAILQIQKDCPSKSDAQIWYDYCTVRYSQQNFFGTYDASRKALVRNTANAIDPGTFFRRLRTLFEDLSRRAADPANNGFAAGQTSVPGGRILYGAAQCTTDLRSFYCAQCLGAAITEFERYCKPRQGCRVFLSSCFVRYEIYKFSTSLDAGFNETRDQATEKLIRYEFGGAKPVSTKSMMISSS